jgi:hypothetical protein
MQAPMQNWFVLTKQAASTLHLRVPGCGLSNFLPPLNDYLPLFLPNLQIGTPSSVIN